MCEVLVGLYIPYMVNSKIIIIWTYLKANKRIHAPCATYQNTYPQLTVIFGSQQGKTFWPFRFKLMSNINKSLTLTLPLSVSSTVLQYKPDNRGHSMSTGFNITHVKSHNSYKSKQILM